ncbi:MAG: MFS transporter [Caulobacterales bacterium]|nr:MFS transporter [Caulobacterales bacterium]
MDEVKQKKKIFYGWYLLAACWLIVFFCQAFPNYGATVMNGFMAKEFKASRESMGGMFSIYLMLGGAPGLIAGAWVAKMGSRALILSGAVALIIGSVMMAFWANNVSDAFWGFGVFVGYAHFAGGFLGTQYALAQWFHRRRALAMSILYSAAGFGGFISPPLLNGAIEMAGGEWRVGWWVMIAAGFLTCLLAIAFLKDKPEEMGLHPDGDENAKIIDAAAKDDHAFRTKDEWSLKETFSTWQYWALLFGFAAPSMGFATYLAHGVLHLRDVGFSPAIAAGAISITAMASLLSKLLVGALGDKYDPKYIWILFLGIMGIGMFLFAGAKTQMDMVIAVSCLGSGFGGMLVCMVTVLPNYFGVKVFPVLSGFSLTLQGTLIAFVPTLVGQIYDRTGTYANSFHVISGFCFIMALVLIFVKRPRRKITQD